MVSQEKWSYGLFAEVDGYADRLVSNMFEEDKDCE